MKKRGQIYLLATIVILVLISGVIFVQNYSAKKENTRVEEIKNELQTEAGKILDLGALTGNYPWQSFTQNFSNYIGSGIEIVYITGNLTSPEVYYYEQERQNIDFNNAGGLIDFEFEGVIYEFKLNQGENFYFVVSQEVDGEKYVAKG